MAQLYKLVVGVPEADADAVRRAIGDAGAGRVGNYSHASFSSKGVGRFKPLEGSNPTIGQLGKVTEVPEEQIETVCDKEHLSSILKALQTVHPYETPVVDIFEIQSMDQFL